MNKFLIPAALVATVVIAGIFAFMPVEKASTVHGNLASSTDVTTINTNVDSEADNLDRSVTFSKNYSLFESDSNAGVVLVLVDDDATDTTGRIVVGAKKNADPNNSGVFECGAVDAGGTAVGTNATSSSTGTATTSASFTISDADDILIGADGVSSTTGGVCTITIYFDTNAG
ncbi:MAG: hypothetical protein FJ360_02580 [Thaumarchaeota archaeon]|nr:hypothetical protein [Nitrososphaerota archaeon]